MKTEAVFMFIAGLVYGVAAFYNLVTGQTLGQFNPDPVLSPLLVIVAVLAWNYHTKDD